MLDVTGLAAGLAFGAAVAVALRSLPALRHGPARWAVAPAALLVAGLGAAPVWRGLVTGYAGDSFFTLSPAAGVGLALLSLALIVLLFAISRAKSRWLAGLPGPAGAGPGLWALDLAATLALAYLALWLVPQVYYLYYLTVFDGLPWQSVIKPPPAAGAFFHPLLLSEPASLSTHLQGVTARALLLASAAPPALALAARAGVAWVGALWVGGLAAASHLAGSLVLTAIGL